MTTKKLVFVRYNDETHSGNVKSRELNAEQIKELSCTDVREIKYDSCQLCTKEMCPKHTVRECIDILLASLN